MIKVLQKKKSLRWGVAGLGRYAEHRFLPALMNVHRAELVSVFSNSMNRAKEMAKKFGALNAYDSYDDFLASEIDAIYIGSANAHHYEQVIKAAKAGKKIHCDKPLAITSEEAEEMVKVCDECSVPLSINYVYRYHPLIKKAKELLFSQKIGKLISISAHFNINFVPGDNFRYNKELSGGGAMRDLGTHLIDMMRLFGGEIASINGCIDNVFYKSEVDDFAHGIMKFEKGGHGYFNVSFNNPMGFNRIEILGSKGSIALDQVIAQRAQSSKLTIMLEGEARKSFRKRANQHYRAVKEINRAFLDNEPTLATGMDGLINMRLMEKIEK